MQKLLNIYDVASTLGVSVSVVYKLMYRYGLPYCKLGVNTKFNPEDIEYFIQAHTIHRSEAITSQSQGGATDGKTIER